MHLAGQILNMQDADMEEAVPKSEASLDAPTEFLPKARRHRNTRNKA